MTNTDKPQGIGLSEAAAHFEAFLDPGTTDKPDVSPQDDASTAAETENEVTATAAEDVADETPSADTDNEESADPDAEATDEATDDEEAQEGEEAEDKEPETYTVKVDGKEVQVTLDELLAGYSRTADYTRKTQALAEERRSFESEREAVRIEREQYKQLLPALIESIKLTVQEPDWDALADNPTEYIKAQREWQEKQERIAAAQAEYQRLQEQEAAEAAQARARMMAQSAEELLKFRPEWKNPDAWASERAKLVEYGKSIGFSEDELREVYDHRAIITLWKARQYDELMSKKPKPTPKQGPKPVPPGAKPHAPRAVSDISRAKQRLAKTGRVKDAIPIFATLVDDV